MFVFCVFLIFKPKEVKLEEPSLLKVMDRVMWMILDQSREDETAAIYVM